MPMTYRATGGGDYEKVPAGTHIAVCNLVADVGLQPGSAAFPDPKPKLFMRFEVPAERMTYTKDGAEVEGPMTIYANFTASMNKKANLRKVLENWRGKKFTDQEAESFDVASILGKACMILVTHSADGKYANVDNVMALPKGTKAPKAENELVMYSEDEDGQFDDLPNFLKKKVEDQLDPIDNTPEPAAQPAPRSAPPSDSFDDDEIPF